MFSSNGLSITAYDLPPIPGSSINDGAKID